MTMVHFWVHKGFSNLVHIADLRHGSYIPLFLISLSKNLWMLKILYHACVFPQQMHVNEVWRPAETHKSTRVLKKQKNYLASVKHLPLSTFEGISNSIPGWMAIKPRSDHVYSTTPVFRRQTKPPMEPCLAFVKYWWRLGIHNRANVNLIIC